MCVFVTMASNIVSLCFVNEQLKEWSVSLIYDTDINAYKANVDVSLKFPLLANLSILQQLRFKTKTHYELLFSSNEKDLVRIFLYEQNQKLYSNKPTDVRINEDFIFNLLYNNQCDEAVLYYDGKNFDYIYQRDTEQTVIQTIWSFLTSMTAKAIYTVVAALELYTLGYKIYQQMS